MAEIDAMGKAIEPDTHSVESCIESAICPCSLESCFDNDVPLTELRTA